MGFNPVQWGFPVGYGWGAHTCPQQVPLEATQPLKSQFFSIGGWGQEEENFELQ